MCGKFQTPLRMVRFRVIISWQKYDFSLFCLLYTSWGKEAWVAFRSGKKAMIFPTNFTCEKMKSQYVQSNKVCASIFCQRNEAFSFPPSLHLSFSRTGMALPIKHSLTLSPLPSPQPNLPACIITRRTHTIDLLSIQIDKYESVKWK